MLARTSGITDISLTTNGLLLPRYAADLRRAGLRRVNVSLDSLEPARFARISRGGRLAEALAGLDAAFAAGFDPGQGQRAAARGRRGRARWRSSR